MSLKNQIAAEAQRLGFSLFGVVEPDSPSHYAVYERWVDQGKHGEMHYLDSERARERRKYPRLILPECESILVLGWPYPSPFIQENALQNNIGRPHGRTAAYAWEEDYHNVLPGKLKALVEFVEDSVGRTVPNRWYTDTGPILERDLAQQAGLGWIGKNTCLINPQKGSYFLLAEIFLGIDLEPDKPFEADRCGTCTRCIDACPTNCIEVNRTIDASRCISYLTIELKGAIPMDLREMMGDWVFGCDICQEVCPWNQRFASPGEGDQKYLIPGEVDLISELALSRQAFNRKFKHSPIKRSKRRGYLRNIAVALGNSSSTAGIGQLLSSLHYDLEPLVRGHSAWALGRIDNEQVRQGLLAALPNEKDPFVQEEINLALGG
jgi:epoxyqueuosine reductase